MKRKGIPLWVGILIISVAIAGVVALLVADIASPYGRVGEEEALLGGETVYYRQRVVLCGVAECLH